MVRKKYVEVNTFEDMRDNTTKLVDILNHSMTQVKNDIVWLKTLQGWQIGILVAILASIITVAIRI